MKFTIHIHLVLRFKNKWSCTPLPLVCFHGVVGDVTITFTINILNHAHSFYWRFILQQNAWVHSVCNILTQVEKSYHDKHQVLDREWDMVASFHTSNKTRWNAVWGAEVNSWDVANSTIMRQWKQLFVNGWNCISLGPLMIEFLNCAKLERVWMCPGNMVKNDDASVE
jgi:hypothetical protein